MKRVEVEGVDPVPPAAQIGPLRELADSLVDWGVWEEAWDAYRLLFRAALCHADLPAAADATRGEARARQGAGRYQEALELAELSYELSQRAELPLASSRALNVLGSVHLSRQELELATAAFEQARETAAQAGDDTVVAFACQNLGVVANIRGKLREARAFYLEAVAAFTRVGAHPGTAVVQNNLGMVCADLGDHAEAVQHFDRGVELAEGIGNQPLLARLHANRAEPFIHLGETEKARADLDTALRVARRVEAGDVEAAAYRLRGVIARLGGDLAAAERCLERALEIATEGGHELERIETLGGLATIRRAQGRAGEARELLLEARAGFVALGAERDVRRLDGVLEEWDLPAAAGGNATPVEMG
ncbi:MAG: tetratricopeptide repeat protein [Longimicrobiaceae bacterium]